MEQIYRYANFYVTFQTRVAKFCMQVEYFKCWTRGGIVQHNGRDQVTHFLILAPIISGIGEARHCKCRVQIGTEEY